MILVIHVVQCLKCYMIDDGVLLTGETYSVRSESCIFSGSLLSSLLKSTGGQSSVDFDVSLLPDDDFTAALCLPAKHKNIT